MGLEVVEGFINWIRGSLASLHGISPVLAWVGIAILLFLGAVYGGMALYRAIKAIAYMPVRKFVAMLALTGVALIVLAIVIP
ncbi:MAG: hypothetical protein GXO32_08535 [Crenarchaeota archaeon]|nr:hypothetical protein [Thermoproteota archaeon]